MTEFSPAAPSDKIYRLTGRANDLFERHHYLDAIQEYTKIIQLIPADHPDYLALLHANRSASYLWAKRFEDASNDATHTMRFAPAWAKGYFRFAEVLLHQGHFQQAIDYYQQALEKDPENTDISARIGRAVIEQDNEKMGLTIVQLLPGRDIAIERNFRNPIQNRIYEFAEQMRNIIHVIADNETKQCVLVDACWDLAGILHVLDERGYILVAAVVTHYHFDHVGGSPPAPYDTLPIKIAGLATLLKKFPHIKAYVHPEDIPFVRQANPSIIANRLVPTCTQVTDTLLIGRTKIRFLHTPGHTPGSQALLVNDARLIAGDTLLCGHCGRTDLPGGDRRVMEHTLRHTLGKLNDCIVVYPGHQYGSEWSTIGIERENGCLGDDLVGFGMRETAPSSYAASIISTSGWSKRHSL